MTHLSQHRSSEDTDEQAHTQMYLRALSPRVVGQELPASANCALRPLQLPVKNKALTRTKTRRCLGQTKRRSTGAAVDQCTHTVQETLHAARLESARMIRQLRKNRVATRLELHRQRAHIGIVQVATRHHTTLGHTHRRIGRKDRVVPRDQSAPRSSCSRNSCDAWPRASVCPVQRHFATQPLKHATPRAASPQHMPKRSASWPRLHAWAERPAISESAAFAL